MFLLSFLPSFYSSFSINLNCPTNSLSDTTCADSSSLVAEVSSAVANVFLEVIVSITVQNVGNCDGAETIQIYVKNPKSSIARAVYEIESYLKVGEEKTIEIRLPKEAFGLYQKEKKCFVTEEGIFEIQIGTAIDDICLQEEFELEHGYAYLTL